MLNILDHCPRALKWLEGPNETDYHMDIGCDTEH